MRRLICLAFALVLPLGLFLWTPRPALAAIQAATKTFGGWTASCNNLGDCVVLGTAQDDVFYLRFARGAGAATPPDLKIVLVSPEKIKGAVTAFKLTASDAGKKTPLGPYAAERSGDDTDVLTAKLGAGEPTLAIIEAIRNAKTLDYTIGEATGTLDLTGLTAALRYIDAQQGRAGTPTALVARGMTPISQVPPRVDAPLVSAAPAGSVTEIEKPVLSKPVLAAAEAVCDPDVVKAHDGAAAWTLGPDRTLVAVPCSEGAYNTQSALYLTKADGSAPEAVHLPQPAPVADGESDNTVTNYNFDPKTMQLSSFDKGRGIGDCGSNISWLWTGSAFVLLEASGLEACPGALPEDWPNLYTAKRE